MIYKTLSFLLMAVISRWVEQALERTQLMVTCKVEYAVKAVENGGTCIGIRCKDGVVLATEKILTSKLLKHGANRRIAAVDRNIGIVGIIPYVLALR